MPEHRIRLRGGWEWSPDRSEPGPGLLKTLPVVWEVDPGSPFTLTRRFGRPRVDPDRERVALELSSVPGLCSSRLNGQDLAVEFDQSGRCLLPVDSLLWDRNTLVIEADVRRVEPRTFLEEWGVVAILIIRDG